MEDPTAGYFDCTNEERAAFEAGIKLGSIYHQFVGSPVSPKNAENLARAMEEATRLQPFVEDVRVRIDLTRTEEAGPFPYLSLTGEMLQVDVVVRYGDAVAVGEMRYEEALRYPLMRIREMRRGGRARSSPSR